MTQVDFIDNPEDVEITSSGIQNNCSSLLQKVSRQLDEYFSGKRHLFKLPLKPQGTVFQLSAWNSLLQIPFVITINYLQQTLAIGNPRAVRAVGVANARNPIPIIIPCHRVIGKKGSLTGYAGGMGRKKRLIELEVYALTKELERIS